MCSVEGSRSSQDSSVVKCQDLMSKNTTEMTKLYLRWSDIVDDRLVYTMGKNKKSVSLQIPEKAKQIIDSYRKDEQNKSSFIFPELEYAKLSKIGSTCTN